MISILIPIYNGVEFLNESLSSVLNQTYSDWEVIIGINGHSKNSDVEIYANKIKQDLCSNDVYEKIRIIHYETKGKSATLNAMVKDSIYNLIALLDVDDIWLPNKLEKQSAYWNKYDIIGTQCEYFGNIKGSPNIPFGDISNHDFFQGNPIINCSVIIKKEDAKWNDDNYIVEDYELWLQLRMKNKTFYNISDVLCLHRIHNNSHFNGWNHLHVPKLIEKYKKMYQQK
jgi:teichuronic acid biosynthesis glycosyltransferase TuaG